MIRLSAVVSIGHAHGWHIVFLDELHFLQTEEGDAAVVLVGDFQECNAATVNYDARHTRAAVVLQVGAEWVDAEAADFDELAALLLVQACPRKFAGLESAFQGEAADGLLGCGDVDGDVCCRGHRRCRKREAGGIRLVPEQIWLARLDVFGY